MNCARVRFLLAAAAMIALACAANAQPPGTNYDESKVPDYTLPDPLVLADGGQVADADAWRRQRRPEILELFERFVDGKAPGRPEDMTFHVRTVATDALEGKATRKEVSVWFTGKPDGPKMDVLIYLPNDATKHTHPSERALFKTTMLGTQYGIGARVGRARIGPGVGVGVFESSVSGVGRSGIVF